MPWMNRATADRVKFEFKDVDVEFTKHTTNLHVKQEKLIDLLTHLKEKEGYRHFIDHTCIDFPDKRERFQGIYILYNPDTNERVIVKTWAKDGKLPSLEKLWHCARWAEREAYDMFGIIFEGHPDLRRILMPYDWPEGSYPLRKDFQVPEFYNGMKVPY